MSIENVHTQNDKNHQKKVVHSHICAWLQFAVIKNGDVGRYLFGLEGHLK